MWNEMMHTGVNATLEATSTDYRDRVDRMAAAIITGCLASRLNNDGYWDTRLVIDLAIGQIDAIDEMLKEREASL